MTYSYPLKDFPFQPYIQSRLSSLKAWMKGGMILSRYSLLRNRSKARDGRYCRRGRRGGGSRHRHRQAKRRRS